MWSIYLSAELVKVFCCRNHEITIWFHVNLNCFIITISKFDICFQLTISQITVSGSYVLSCFGSSIEVLVRMFSPIREVDTAELIQIVSAWNVFWKLSPVELMKLIDLPQWQKCCYLFEVCYISIRISIAFASGNLWTKSY